MQKLLVLSVCLALLIIPLVAARDPHPGRGLKRARLGVLAFNLFYVVLLRGAQGPASMPASTPASKPASTPASKPASTPASKPASMV